MGCPQAKGRLKLRQGPVELFGDPAQGVGAFGEGDVCPEGLQLQSLALREPREEFTAVNIGHHLLKLCCSAGLEHLS